MTYIPGILLAYSAFLLAIASPGPNIIAVIGTSMSVGRSSGVALALGVASGSFTWALLTVVGLSALLAAYSSALMFIKIFGGLYLLWLAYKAFRSAATPDGAVVATSAAGDRLYLRGLAIQMTNPKAALHWIAIVAIGLGPDQPLWVGVALVLSATALSLVGHLAYAVTFSTQPVIAFYRRARRWIEGGLGLFFVFAAFKIATHRG